MSRKLGRTPLAEIALLGKAVREVNEALAELYYDYADPEGMDIEKLESEMAMQAKVLRDIASKIDKWRG